METKQVRITVEDHVLAKEIAKRQGRKINSVIGRAIRQYDVNSREWVNHDDKSEDLVRSVNRPLRIASKPLDNHDVKRKKA